MNWTLRRFVAYSPAPCWKWWQGFYQRYHGGNMLIVGWWRFAMIFERKTWIKPSALTSTKEESR